MKIFLICLILINLSIFENSISQTKTDSISKWAFSITTNGFYQSGNTNKFWIQGKSEIKHTGKLVEVILSGSVSYGETRKKKDDNTYYSSFTTDFFYKDKWSPFFLQYFEYNFSKGFDLRSQTGVGVKYVFIENPDHKTSISVAGIYDYLDLVDKPGNSKVREARFSVRLKTKQSLIEDRLNFLLTAFYQPVMNDFSKRNFYVETSLETPVSKVVKLNVNYIYGFDDVVSVGRKRADNKLTFGCGLFF